MKLSLLVLTPGKGEGKVIPVTLAQFLIGRDPQCNLRPASPVISKRHCAVLVRGEKAFIKDFDSTNGTFLNDQPVKGEVELHHGDQLKAGPLQFSVQLEAAPAVSSPPPATPAAKKSAPSKAGLKPAAEDLEATTVGKGSGGESSEDESIAEMLLSIGDDEGTGNPIIPEGSTIMDIPIPPPGTETPGDPKSKDKMSQAKSQQASTSNAAKAILDKYMRRPRS